MAYLHGQWLMLHVYILINIFTACESNNTSRIIGGEDTTIRKHPWQAYLLLGTSGFCGATIIGRHWVVTAAHCVAGRSVRCVHYNINV